MQRILHIVESFAGGVLAFLADLTSYQVEGNDVFILYGRRPHTPTDLSTLFDSRVHLIESSSFDGPYKTLVKPSSYREVRKTVAELCPDVVHLHSTIAGFVGRWSLRHKNGIKLFYTPHGYAFLKKDSNAIIIRCYHVAEKFFSRYAVTIACGFGEYQEARKISKECRYVCNGVNTSRILEGPRPQPGAVHNRQEITICTSGRIAFQKNPSLFNEIAGLLPQYRFMWVGDGDMRGCLNSPNIEITGWQDHMLTISKVRDCDVFILTSLWEGLPISLLESMCLAKPCIVTDIPGNRDVINDGENGFICKSASEFALKIQELVADEPFASRVGNAAQGTVIRDYDFKSVAEKYHRIYEECYN